MSLEISICSGDYDRIQGLKSGTVAIEGCTLSYRNHHPAETFRRLFDDHEFDVAEMSFSSYLVALGQGGFPYRAIPVFLSRVFAHGSIYLGPQSTISEPGDLKGKRVGAPNYHFTRGLCVRGLLADEYGVAPGDMLWRTGGVDSPGGLGYLPIEAPANVEIEPIGADQTLAALLLAGEIEAIVSYRDPEIFSQRRPGVRRLFADFRSLEKVYFQKTGIFPIMHVVGIRETLLAAYPWLAGAVYRGFAEAKALALPRLVDLDALAVMLPWLVAEAEATIELMGADYWPYGVAPNRATLEAQTRWSFEQGLTPRRYAPEEIFAEMEPAMEPAMEAR
ncbi:MAG TPA: ABC transporter substrate-binding protein [Alphaproteobacteria bacterium]|jgi:4,5-dihydroxyphthalate decarboxylase|nr:ABC transporter substrate-binding protein [Alphaproteobacteria bacterium]